MSSSKKIRSGWLCLFVAVLGTCLTAEGASAAWYAKFDGIDGEVSVVGFEGQMELESFSWGVSNPGSFSAGAAGGGKVSVHDFSFVKLIDKASPVLMKTSCAGDRIPEVTMTLLRTVGEKPVKYMEIKMTDCLISSYSMGGTSSGDELPLESLSLNFTKIEFDYSCQPETGLPCQVTAECVSEPITK